jgi:archaeal preflagellin peptidase FlaK
LTEFSSWVFGAQIAVLLTGFGYAAANDLKVREVDDHLWQLMSVAALLLGVPMVMAAGTLPTLLWILVSLFVVQHMFPWDAGLERRSESLPGIVELTLYIGVILVIGLTVVWYGIGPTQVPWTVLAVLASVLLARGLFEGGVLYGGADAKALMVAGTLLPISTVTLLPVPAAVAPVLALYPFSVTVLMNAALFTLVVPVSIAIVNLRRHEFHFPKGFLGYTISVEELPHRWVWLRDPTFGGVPDAAEAGTSAEDREYRERTAAQLEAQGVRRLWVTPQVPFLVILSAGVVAALVAGNLFFDLIGTL